jgi:hypothetical protein
MVIFFFPHMIYLSLHIPTKMSGERKEMDLAQEQKKEQVTYENIAPSKLLNYVKKTDLVAFITPQQYAEMENKLKQDLGVSKVNLKQMKQSLATNREFVTALKQNELGQQAFQKYQASVARFRDPALRARSKLVRQKMSQPRRRYIGCLATKLQPEDYRDCYNSYEDLKYDNMRLVPQGLKKHVFNTTSDDTLRDALRPSVMNPNNSFSDLPSGLRRYIRSNPSEFASYVEERKQELRLLRSVLRNMPIQEKQRLRAYFAQHKNIPLREFSAIIRGDRKDNISGQKRGRGEKRFNIKGTQGSYFDDNGIEHYAPSERTFLRDGGEDWDAESVFTSLSDF